MISIWDITIDHLGTYQDVTDGVNVWSGEVLDFFEYKGYALRDGAVVEQVEREAFIGDQRHTAYGEDRIVKGEIIEG